MIDDKSKQLFLQKILTFINLLTFLTQFDTLSYSHTIFPIHIKYSKAAAYIQIPSVGITLNFNLDSLCLKNIMPISRPIPPPNIEKLSKKLSDNRHLFLMAYDLSNIIATHAARFITTKNIAITIKSIVPPRM